MRLAIQQNPEKLLAMDPAGFDYDLKDRQFLKYFTSRTGYVLVCPEFWVDPKNPVINSERSTQITRAKIQDAWNIWIQPGYQQDRKNRFKEGAI